MYIPLVVGLSRTVLYFYCSQHAIARVRLTLMFISLYPVGCLVYCIFVPKVARASCCSNRAAELVGTLYLQMFTLCLLFMLFIIPMELPSTLDQLSPRWLQIISTSLVYIRGHFRVTTAADNVQISTVLTDSNPISSMTLPHLQSSQRDSSPGIKTSSHLLDTASDHLRSIYDDLVRPIKVVGNWLSTTSERGKNEK